MPASLSRNRELESPASRRLILTIALLTLIAVIVVVLLVLPASLLTRFLPPQIRADDFSGSIWHGSSGHVTVLSRSLGALEWRLHPGSLLAMAVAADVRWVKGAAVIEGEVTLNARGFDARNLRGAGPLEDLRDLGVAPGWRGIATLDLKEVKGTFEVLQSAAGRIEVAAVSAASIAHGADLGGYVLTLDHSADDAAGLLATLEDTGGPLEVRADIHYTPAAHSGLLSGTIKPRAAASPELEEELNQLAQMRPRDDLGRIPVEFEFAM